MAPSWAELTSPDATVVPLRDDEDVAEFVEVA